MKHLLVLCWGEAGKAQMALFGQPGADHSRGGRLVREVRVHANGRRVNHWVLRPQPDAPVAPAPQAQEGVRSASRRYEQKADVARIWRMEAESAYSGLLPVVAVREAAQNGLDAVRKALRLGQVTEGKFEVTYDSEAQRITIADNGVGMDRDTLQDKFLTLGATGKGDEAAAVGGFGVAKAAILGSPDFANGGGWEIATRDLRLTNDMLGRDLEPGEDVGPHQQGVKITLNKVGLSRWSNFEGETIELLASSDVGKGVAASFNGKPIRPMWQGLRGKRLDFSGIEWPEGVQATVTRYRVPEGAGRPGKMFIRTGGLTQWSSDFYAAKGSDYDYVMDLDITARPGSKEYPLAKSRQSFQGQAAYCFGDIKGAIERELQTDDSQKRVQEWEDFEVDADGRIKGGKATAALIDEEPDDLAHMLAGIGGADALKELAAAVQAVAGPTRSQPDSVSRASWSDDKDSVLGALTLAVEAAGGNVENIVSAGGDAQHHDLPTLSGDEHAEWARQGHVVDEPGRDTHAWRVLGGKMHGQVVHVRHARTGDGHDWRGRGVLSHIPHDFGDPVFTDDQYAKLRQVALDERTAGREHPYQWVKVADETGALHGFPVYLSPEKIAEVVPDGPAPRAPKGGGDDDAVVARGGRPQQGGLVKDHITDVVSDKVTGFRGQVRTGIPFVITRNNAAWPKRRKLNMKKLAPGLLVWDSIVRATASAAGLNHRLKTGVVLDDGVLGLHDSKAGVHNIYIHPDHLMDQLGARTDPMAAAVRLHNMACHEMAHNTYSAHDEEFSSHTEDLRRRSAHVVSTLATIIERVTGRKTAATATRDKLAKDLEKSKATAAQHRKDSATRIRALEAEVKRLKALAAAPAPAPAPAAPPPQAPVQAAPPPAPAPTPKPAPPPPQAPAQAPRPQPPAQAPRPQPPAQAAASQFGLFGGETPVAAKKRRAAPVAAEQIGFGFKAFGCKVNRLVFGGAYGSA